MSSIFLILVIGLVSVASAAVSLTNSVRIADAIASTGATGSRGPVGPVGPIGPPATQEYFEVYSTQTIFTHPHTNINGINFDDIRYNIGNSYEGGVAPNFIPAHTGVYLFSLILFFPPQPNLTSIIGFVYMDTTTGISTSAINPSVVSQTGPSSNNGTCVNGSVQIYLNAGQYIQAVLYGVTSDLAPIQIYGLQRSMFSGKYLG